MTQEQFAEAAGISYKFYQSIEAGRKKQIWLDTVGRLAAAFGLEAWQLLAPEEPKHTSIAAKTERLSARAVAEASGSYRVTRSRRNPKPQ